MAKPRVKYDLDTGTIVQAICSAKPEDWATFFEILRLQQYNKIRGAVTDADRNQIHNSVKALDSIEHQFEEIRTTKKFSA